MTTTAVADLNGTPMPTPTPATVAEISRMLRQRAERIRAWNEQLERVARLAVAAHFEGCGLAIAVDHARNTITAEVDEDIPDRHAVIVAPGKPPRLIRLDTTNLRRIA